MELFGVNSHILKPLGQSSAICSEKWHMLKGVNCLNFVFDCGSSDVTCPQIMFYWIVLCCYFLKVFGDCKLGLAEIVVFYWALSSLEDWLFRISPFPEPNTVPGTQLNLDKTF